MGPGRIGAAGVRRRLLLRLAKATHVGRCAADADRSEASAGEVVQPVRPGFAECELRPIRRRVRGGRRRHLPDRRRAGQDAAGEVPCQRRDRYRLREQVRSCAFCTRYDLELRAAELFNLEGHRRGTAHPAVVDRHLETRRAQRGTRRYVDLQSEAADRTQCQIAFAELVPERVVRRPMRGSAGG